MTRTRVAADGARLAAVSPAHEVDVVSRARRRAVAVRWSRRSPALIVAALVFAPAISRAAVRISEVHYHPPSPVGKTHEFIELTNDSAADVSIGGWRIEGGVAFDFPFDASLPAGGRAVVCRDQDALAAAFALPRAAVFGDYAGALANAGERLALLDSAGETVDVARYRDRDDWPYTADGEGRSLEKIHPLADGQDPASWSASRMRPAGFMQRSDVGPLNTLTTQRVIIGINGAGEFVVDDVVLEAIVTPGVNLIDNGDFELGPEPWTFRGTAAGSTVDAGIGTGGSSALRLVTEGSCGADCDACGSSNSVYFGFRTGELDPRAEYRLSVRFRYVSGSPEFYCRVLQGARICVGELLVSPGTANGARADVLPPFVSHRGRDPEEPRSGEENWVSARVRAPTAAPVESVTLGYRAGDGDLETVAMADDGASGDADAGDGVWGVRVPGNFGHDTVVLYRITARTSGGVETVAPHTLHAGAARKEDFWGFYVNDEQPESVLPVWHALIPGVDSTDPMAINRALDCDLLRPASFACAGEVYPDCSVRFRGNTACALEKRNLKFRFNRGRYFEGLRKLNLQGMWTDKSLVREHLAWDLIREFGVPYCETDYVRVHVNGRYHGLFLWLEHPDGRFLERNGLDGEDCLFKAKQPAGGGGALIGVAAQTSLDQYERFWEQETCEDGDLSGLAAFVDSMHGDSRQLGGPTAEFFFARSNPEHVIGYQLAQTLLNNIDSFAKNHFLYQDVDSDRWSVLTWDMDLVFGKFFDPDAASVGTLNDCMLSPNPLELDPWFSTSLGGNVRRHYFVDFFFNAGGGYFQRAYLVRLWDLLEEKYRNDVYDPRLDELVGFLAQEQADDVERWGRSAPACAADCFEICADESSMAGNVDEVKRQLSLHRGFLASHIRRAHPEIPGHGRLKLTEICFDPLDGNPDLEFVELLNTSGRSLDVSEWALTGGITYVFPRGTVVPVDGIVLVVKSRAAFRAQYPGVESRALVVGDFAGALDNSGDVLRLIDDGEASSSYPATIDLVAYRDGGEWPDVVPGHSIELTEVAATRDNDPGANWRLSAAPLGTPGDSTRPFVRGDAAEDGVINLSDAVKILAHLFLGDTTLDCLDAADADDDGVVLLTDPVYVLEYLFQGGSPPPLPFPIAGSDRTDDGLDCR